MRGSGGASPAATFGSLRCCTANFPLLLPDFLSALACSPRRRTRGPMTNYVPSLGLEVLGQGAGLRKWAILPRSRDPPGPAAKGQACKTLDYYSPLARQLSPSAASALFLAASAASSEWQ